MSLTHIHQQDGDGMVMVTTRERAADLKTLLDALPAELRGS